MEHIFAFTASFPEAGGFLRRFLFHSLKKKAPMKVTMKMPKISRLGDVYENGGATALGPADVMADDAITASQ